MRERERSGRKKKRGNELKGDRYRRTVSKKHRIERGENGAGHDIGGGGGAAILVVVEIFLR